LSSLSASETRSAPGVGEVRQVALLSLPPRRSRVLVGVGERVDDHRHPSAEAAADVPEASAAAPVLGGVVKERRDRLLLGAAVVDHQRGDAEQVLDVGLIGAGAKLACVHPRCVGGRLVKPIPDRSLTGERVPHEGLRFHGNHLRLTRPSPGRALPSRMNVRPEARTLQDRLAMRRVGELALALFV
jgi:hypothetical protein